MGGLCIRKRISKHRATGPAGSRLPEYHLSFLHLVGRLISSSFRHLAVIGAVPRLHRSRDRLDLRLPCAPAHQNPYLVGSLEPPIRLAAGDRGALSLAATAALMIMARVNHPPAGAMTLIVSLGIITEPSHLVIMELAVAVLTLQAYWINRLAGIPYPAWRELPADDRHSERYLGRLTMCRGYRLSGRSSGTTGFLRCAHACCQALRPTCFRRGFTKILATASACGASRLPRERRPGRRRPAFAFQGMAGGTRPFRRQLPSGWFGRFPARIGWKLHTRLAGLVQADRDDLLGVARSMLAFTDMVHFLADKLTALRSRCLSFTCIFAGSLDSLFSRHLTPLRLLRCVGT